MPLYDLNSPASVAPYSDAATVTKSDSTVVAFRALYVGGTGDVAVITDGGTTLTFETVPAGTVLPIVVSKVLSTGTSATKIVGLK